MDGEFDTSYAHLVHSYVPVDAHQYPAAAAAAAAVHCQVRGCGVLLTGGKSYCIKKRTCVAHMAADAVFLGHDVSTQYRFCQQCGKFEELAMFDGNRRSCRSRLAKRRSGTRALLQKKGFKDKTIPAEQAVSWCASAGVDTAGTAAEAQLLSEIPADNQQLLFEHEQEQQQYVDLLEGACTNPTAEENPAARTRPKSAHSSPEVVDSATSDGEASAVAASACPGQSAPARVQGHNLLKSLGDPGLAVDTGADTLGCMDQTELLLALQAADASDSLRVAQHAAFVPTTAAAAQAYDAAAAAHQMHALGAVRGQHVGPSPYQGLEHARMSVPLPSVSLVPAHALGSVQTGSWSQGDQQAAPNSPVHSVAAGGSAAFHSAPLAKLQHTSSWHRLAGDVHAGQRARSSTTAAAHHRQQHTSELPRSSGRLRWLIQELQQELEVCRPSELEQLNNDELGTLLCAALTPTPSSSAAQGDASQQGQVPNAATAVQPIGLDDSSTASLVLAGSAQTGMQGMRTAPLNQAPLPPRASLSSHQAQVLQLQHQVQLLQTQLHSNSTANIKHHGRYWHTQQPAQQASAAAGTGLTPHTQGVSDPSLMPAAGNHVHGGYISRMKADAAPATAPLPKLHVKTVTTALPANCSQPLASVLSHPSTPCSESVSACQVGAAQGMDHTAAGDARKQQLQLAQPVSSGLAAASAAGGGPAVQLEALQQQLRVVEEEMRMLLSRQVAPSGIGQVSHCSN